MIVTPTQSDIRVALRGFLVGVLASNVEVVEAQDNRVPEPTSEDFVLMTGIRHRRIETNSEGPVQPIAGTQDHTQPTEAVFQLDVHGPNSADNAEVISTLFRSAYAVDAMAAINPDVYPLHADDPKQVPFINDANQYESRWVIEAFLQANQTVSVPQQSAEALAVDLIDVDAVYPP